MGRRADSAGFLLEPVNARKAGLSLPYNRLRRVSSSPPPVGIIKTRVGVSPGIAHRVSYANVL